MYGKISVRLLNAFSERGGKYILHDLRLFKLFLKILFVQYEGKYCCLLFFSAFFIFKDTALIKTPTFLKCYKFKLSTVYVTNGRQHSLCKSSHHAPLLQNMFKVICKFVGNFCASCESHEDAILKWS